MNQQNVQFHDLAPVGQTRTTMGMIVYFLMGRPKNQETPEVIGAYTLRSQIHKKQTQHNYGVGVYEKENTLYFIKTWKGRIKNSNYYSLINEYFLSKKLRGILLRSGSKDVQVPQIIEVLRTSGSLSLVYEYIDGEHLGDVPLSDQFTVFSRILKHFKYISNNLSLSEKSQFPRRSAIFHTVSLFISTCVVVILKPSAFRLLFRVFRSSIATLGKVRKQEFELAHRDLSPANILLKGGIIYLVDCGGLSLTLPNYDMLCVLLHPDLVQLREKYIPPLYLDQHVLPVAYIGVHSLINFHKDRVFSSHYFSILKQLERS